MLPIFKTKPLQNFTLASTFALATLVACTPNQSTLRETNSPYLTKESIEILNSLCKNQEKNNI